MRQPFVSVIVPCYMTAATMGETLDSLLEQGEGVEIIVINDGSPDNTQEIARAYGEQIVYREQANKGVSAARNTGLSLATGQFVQFLDADDRVLPGMVRAFQEEARMNPEIDVWFAEILVGDDDMQITRTLPADLDVTHPLSSLLKHNHLMPQGVYIRTDLVRKIGGLDVKLAGVDDWDLWVRLAQSGAKFGKVDGTWSIWRFRTGSQSKQFLRYWELHQAFFAKHALVYASHLTRAEFDRLKNHALDRDLPHLYGHDLEQPWIRRRINRTVKILQASKKAKGLLPWMCRRLAANMSRRLKKSS